MTELLPPNASQLERDLDASIEHALAIPVRIADVWDPHTCPLDILPWLAWAWSVDLWDENWSVEARRNTTAASLAFHKRKGSPGAMRDALRAAGYGEVEFIERLDARRYDGRASYDGVHFYSESEHWAWYSIVLQKPVSIAQAAQVREILDRAQPERCKLHELRYDQALNLYNAAITYDGAYTHGVVDGQSA
ncbi:phage tail protein I [Tepidicaulis marinus]|uniref:Phage tail protein I n=1 Tax=Tepidicaulis marinus TaxID=1333998 RepID=A0A081B6D0_9HYPH|nr:phage tail protein I [Tepidicaulis marinus]GAK43598.1 phage tail protein I [Tepidicaulis marinus]